MERYSIPKTRDPFINAPFISAGVDPETGLERFWCSSWNDNVGSTGVLIRADGSTRVYRFEKTRMCVGSSAGFTRRILRTMILCG